VCSDTVRDAAACGGIPVKQDRHVGCTSTAGVWWRNKCTNMYRDRSHTASRSRITIVQQAPDANVAAARCSSRVH
jgi:hypothetical protein